MRIDCPYCGQRDAREFGYLGDAGKTRPHGEDAGPATMVDYVYLRDNPAGQHREHWHHALGCHAWLIVTRDTLTHAIQRVEVARASSDQTSGREAS